MQEFQHLKLTFLGKSMKLEQAIDGGPENDWPVGSHIFRCGECHAHFLGPEIVEVCYMCSGLHYSELRIYELKKRTKRLNRLILFFVGFLIISLVHLTINF